MKVICTTQRTPEWYAARRGRITASEIGNVLAKPGGKGHEGYKLRLCLDLEGVPDMDDHEPPPWHREGVNHEAAVVGWYEWERNVTTEHTGFVVHPVHDWLGCSPDGLVGDDGLLECKYRTSLAGWRSAVRTVRPHYQAQVQMMVTGRAWCDVVNLWRSVPTDGTLPVERGHIRRHWADPVLAGWLEERLMAYWVDVLRLRQMRQAAFPAPTRGMDGGSGPVVRRAPMQTG